MISIESSAPSLGEHLPAGTSLLIDGTNWKEAEIRSFECYGAAFNVNLDDFPHFSAIEATVLVLRALGCEKDGITDTTGLPVENTERTIRQRLRATKSRGMEDAIHKSFSRRLLSLASPVSEFSGPIMPHVIAGLAGAAAGITDPTIAAAVRRHRTIENFNPKCFEEDMEDFYEHANIPNRVGSILFGHAIGILDTRHPLERGTIGGRLILGLEEPVLPGPVSRAPEISD